MSADKHPSEMCCMKCMTFPDFLLNLQKVFETRYGMHEPSQARRYVYDNTAEWREYFDDGYTPEEAAAEDHRAGHGL